VTFVEVLRALDVEKLEPGQAYLVTLPEEASLEQARAIMTDLGRWMQRTPDPPHFFVRRADTQIASLRCPRCPRCGAEMEGHG
jgi:hypothetical protein